MAAPTAAISTAGPPARPTTPIDCKVETTAATPPPEAMPDADIIPAAVLPEAIPEATAFTTAVTAIGAKSPTAATATVTAVTTRLPKELRASPIAVIAVTARSATQQRAAPITVIAFVFVGGCSSGSSTTGKCTSWGGFDTTSVADLMSYR
eukprot:GHVS01059881.1.p2 GENE.GHVS01059881.1~~GHVS01059881.1.p2  ORF type:complete len:151 (+),score=28.19 GHVS01059881.1:355-807(+)